MKKSLFILSVAISLASGSYGQVFNRAFVNAELGYHYQGRGLYLHLFDHFAAGYNGGQYALAKQRYVNSYVGGIIPTHRWVMDRYYFNTLMGGVTTGDWLGRMCGTVMVGPSWITARECKNIKITENEYSNTEEATYDRVVTQHVGFSMRADFMVSVSQVFGYNFGVRYDANSAVPGGYNFTFQMGLNLGLVRNYQNWRHRF